MLLSPPSSSQGPGQEAVLSHHVAGKQTPLVLPNLPLPTPITGSTHRPWTSPRAEPDHPSLLPLPNPHPGWAAVAVTCSPVLALLQLHHLPLLPSPLSPAHLSTGCLPPSCVSTSVPLEGLCQENTTAPLFWLIHACLPFRPGAPSREATAGSLGRFSPLASPLLSLPPPRSGEARPRSPLASPGEFPLEPPRAELLPSSSRRGGSLSLAEEEE